MTSKILLRFCSVFLFLFFMVPSVLATDEEAWAALGALILIPIILIFFLYLFIVMLALVGFVIWLWMLIDCVRRDNYEDKNDKVIWVIVILLAGLIGAVIYYFVIKRKLDRKVRKKVKSKKK